MSKLIPKQKAYLMSSIEEFVKKGRTIDFERLVPYIRNKCSKSSININDQGIKSILNSFIDKNYIVQGSKLTRDRVLNNKNRQIIYESIKKTPGIYFYKLTKKLNMSNHVVAWHINILYKFNYISKDIIDNHEIYFDSDMERLNAEAAYFLRKEKCKQIIDHLKNDGNIGITKSKLSNDLKKHYNIISKYVDKLEDIGILSAEALSNKTLYYINEKFLENTIELI